MPKSGNDVVSRANGLRLYPPISADTPKGRFPRGGKTVDKREPVCGDGLLLESINHPADRMGSATYSFSWPVFLRLKSLLMAP